MIANLPLPSILPLVPPGAVYLAGPISRLTSAEADDWRQAFAERLLTVGISSYNPMRHKPWLVDKGPILDNYPEHVLGSVQGIMGRDFLDVQRSAVIFANFLGAQDVSVGTVMEVAVGWWLRKVLVVAMEKTPPGTPLYERPNPHDHGMLIGGTNAIVVPSLDEAFATIKGILLP